MRSELRILPTQSPSTAGKGTVPFCGGGETVLLGDRIGQATHPGLVCPGMDAQSLPALLACTQGSEHRAGNRPHPQTFGKQNSPLFLPWEGQLESLVRSSCAASRQFWVDLVCLVRGGGEQLV